MITIEEFMKVIEYRIKEGQPYQWNIYGPNAHYLNYERGEFSGPSVTISIVFDTRTQKVYEMEVWDGLNTREYRWIHPAYIKAYKKESKRRGLKWRQSLDDREFIDLEVEEDILEKAAAVYKGEEYDTRVIVPLNMTKDEQFMLMDLAHKADMTLNDYVAYIMTQAIEQRKKE